MRSIKSSFDPLTVVLVPEAAAGAMTTTTTETKRRKYYCSTVRFWIVVVAIAVVVVISVEGRLQQRSSCSLFLLLSCASSAAAAATTEGAAAATTYDDVAAVTAAAATMSSDAAGAADDSDDDDVVRMSEDDEFPALRDTLEMSALSWLIYKFKHFQEDEDAVCRCINDRNFTTVFPASDSWLWTIPATLPADLRCHWYRHEGEFQQTGTQVMIVSSVTRQYVAVVFAGTDDLRTSLTDANIVMTAFGNDNWTLPDPRVKVHAGFNHAVFSGNLFDDIVKQVDDAIVAVTSSSAAANNDSHDNDTAAAAGPAAAAVRLLATGHSLGASNAVLTAVGLELLYRQRRKNQQRSRSQQQQQQQENDDDDDNDAEAAVSAAVWPASVTSINFGCPRMGNRYWRDFVHMNPVLSNLALWRLVLGWDLVPRLPALFRHAGHTVQLFRNNSSSNGRSRLSGSGAVGGDNLTTAAEAEVEAEAEAEAASFDDDAEGEKSKNSTLTTAALAYYHHYGNKKRGLAGVPVGWYAKSYIWVPGALLSHGIRRYYKFLYQWNYYYNNNKDDNNSSSAATGAAAATRTTVDDQGGENLIDRFVRIDDDDNDENDNDDDDDWVDPPDDDYEYAVNNKDITTRGAPAAAGRNNGIGNGNSGRLSSS